MISGGGDLAGAYRGDGSTPHVPNTIWLEPEIYNTKSENISGQT